MKMLSDLLIGHNWPIIGGFFLSNYSKNQLVDPNVCIALMGIQRTVLIPTYQGKKV